MNNDKKQDDFSAVDFRAAKSAFEYARDVLGGRFERGESAIRKSPMYSSLYERTVLHCTFEDLDRRLILKNILDKTRKVTNSIMELDVDDIL
jgi:hypothetical protein